MPGDDRHCRTGGAFTIGRAVIAVLLLVIAVIVLIATGVLGDAGRIAGASANGMVETLSQFIFDLGVVSE